MKTTYIVLGIFFAIGAVGSGTIASFILGGAIAALFFFLAFRKPKEGGRKSSAAKNKTAQNRTTEGNKDKSPKPSKSVKLSKPVKPAKPKYPPTAENAARRLRAIATAYEDTKVDDFFVMKNMAVTRNTKSTHVRGPGVLVVQRNGIYASTLNPQAQNPKPKEFKKPWSQIIGVTPNSFDLYFSDLTSLEFEPLNPEDFLVLSAFWQVFNDGLNGYSDLIRNPMESGLGNRLRQVAQYIDSHRAECANGALDVNSALGEAELVPVSTPNESFSTQNVGSLIEGWRLIKRLGEGGFGEVFLAENVENPAQLAAIKLMKVDKKIALGSPEFMQNADLFLNEGERSFNFADSAYVLSATGLDTYPWPWIRYPFIAGNTAESLAFEQQMTWDKWWNLAHDLLAGLDAIHSEGLIHKDIKADNVMQTSDRFVILDLGISAVSGYEHFESMGFYPPHLSSEVLEGWTNSRQKMLESFTPKSDVFAAGLTLYWMLTGRNPWPLPPNNQWSTEGRLALMKSQPIDYFDLPADVVHLLSQMLELNPKKRPNARTLLFEIASHVNLDHKLKQMDEAWELWLQRAGEIEDESPVAVEGYFEFEESGPFDTWNEFEELIRKAVEDLKPKNFVLSVDFLGGQEMRYVQATYAAGGWMAECVADTYDDQELTDAEKLRFITLGWSPPTSSDPNFSRNVDGTIAHDLQKLFIAAFEQGYLFKPTDIEKLSLQVQDLGAY